MVFVQLAPFLLLAQSSTNFHFTISSNQEQQIRFNSGKDSLLLQSQRTLFYHGKTDKVNAEKQQIEFALDSIEGNMMAMGGKPQSFRSADSSSRQALLKAGGEKLFLPYRFLFNAAATRPPFFSADELLDPREIEQLLVLRLPRTQWRKGWYQIDSLVTDSVHLVRQQFVQSADSQQVVLKVWMSIRLKQMQNPAGTTLPFQGSANLELRYDAKTLLLQKATTEAQLLGRQFQEEQSLLLRWRNWRLWEVQPN
ncbi:MAG: hypothetical protein EAZ62_06240 [Sphingobacteriia bacterium]|nr:MAG: hypothetical protein EAZ62_06240 [Sphingobacteriia bacterium]